MALVSLTNFKDAHSIALMRKREDLLYERRNENSSLPPSAKKTKHCERTADLYALPNIWNKIPGVLDHSESRTREQLNHSQSDDGGNSIR